MTANRRTFIRYGTATVAAPLLVVASGSAASGSAATASRAGEYANREAGSAAAVVESGQPVISFDTAAPSGRRTLTEGLPIGNGSLGALVCGDPKEEYLALNYDSLFSGGTNPSGNYGTMGFYKMLGSLRLTFGHEDASNYSRALDLETAMVTTSYTSGPTTYTRKSFATYPDKAVITTVTSSIDGALTFVLSLKDGDGSTTAGRNNVTTRASADTNSITVSGQLQEFGEQAQDYAFTAAIVADGGTISVVGNTIEVTGANSATIAVSAATNYSGDPNSNFRSSIDAASTPHVLAEAAIAKSATALEQAHLADYQPLFDRQRIWLGDSTDAQRAGTTFKRVKDNQSQLDPELYALYFQFARYAAIASSRTGGRAMNLQGIWNVSDTPPWNSDYHTNINVQMCYWLGDPAALPETVEPLVELIESQSGAWKQLTAASVTNPRTGAPARGFATRVSHNLNGGMGWEWLATGGAWYAWHLWDHYAHTLDTDFLANRAYPLMRDALHFLQDILVDDGKGKLVIPDSWSSENQQGTPWRNTPVGMNPVQFAHEDGVSMDQEFTWDLMTHFINASAVLAANPAYASTVDQETLATAQEQLAKLHLPATGSWSQLQEWYNDKDVQGDNHRHLSHLVGLFPGERIGASTDEALIDAAKTALISRGVGPTGWSAAWGAKCWAILGDGEKVWRGLSNLTNPVEPTVLDIGMNAGGGVYPNLFDAHPPFQLDGNMGGARAIISMLAQSYLRTNADGTHSVLIRLLPALPAQFPNGSMTGIRLHGGITLDMEWAGGALTKSTFTATNPIDAEVHSAGNVQNITIGA